MVISATPSKGKKPKGPRPKHVPQRTCIACRSTDAKRGFIRLVRTPEGKVEIDPTGKKAGRGAYLCSVSECWKKGLEKKAVENALKVTIDLETRQHLREFGEALPERSAVEVE
jgi:predicted RNA-binding protein YlxR (DUF448 family)